MFGRRRAEEKKLSVSTSVSDRRPVSSSAWPQACGELVRLCSINMNQEKKKTALVERDLLEN